MASRVPPRQHRQLRGQAPPLGAALTYRNVLWSALDRLNAQILELILATWSQNPVIATGVVKVDAIQSSYTTRVIGDLELAVEELIDPTLVDKLGYVAERVNQHGKTEFARVIGIKTHDLGIGGALSGFRDRNVDLIKSLGRDQLGDMREVLTEAEAGAWQTDELRKRLQERFGVSKSKADLLARDQTLKLNGQLTMTRQRNAGITRYIWTTSRDERVRPMHRDLDGTIQDWNNPPVVSPDGRRCHPGDDYQCRCTPYPVLDELDQDLDPEFMQEGDDAEEVKGFHPLDKEVSWQGMLKGIDIPPASLPQVPVAEPFPFGVTSIPAPQPARLRRSPGPRFAMQRQETDLLARFKQYGVEEGGRPTEFLGMVKGGPGRK